MSEWSSLSVENNCRVCMTEGEDFHPIFTSVLLAKGGSSMHLSEMIASFSTVQITLGDGLPEQICNTCAEDTVNFYLFKLKCEETDKFLRKKLVGKIVDCREENTTEIQKQEAENKDQDLPPDNLLENFTNFCDYPDDASSYSVPSPQETSEPIQKTPEKTKEFVCNVCEKQFSREDLLMRHKIAHVKKLDAAKISLENDFDENCSSNQDEGFDLDQDIENKPEDSQVLLKSEQIEVTEVYERLYPCDQCYLIYIHPDDLVEHQNIHQTSEIEINLPKEIEIVNQNPKEKPKINEVEIVCEMCHKRFNKEIHLKRHIRAHRVLKNFICDKCGKGFMRREFLQSHMKSHEGVKPHTCQICLKGFNQISNLKDHMRTHNGEKPFLCSTCGKGFNQLGNLRQHTVRHSGVKAHTCTTCGYAFASKGELGAHLRKHTGVRPFVCNVCNNGFTTSSSLVKHKRIHSGEKPYACDVCHMKFSRSGILARHKRTHTGEKPYICSFCQKAFTQSNDLNSHLRIHTGEKPFICDECGQAFRQNSALKTHKKVHKNREKRAAKLQEINKKMDLMVDKRYDIQLKCDVMKVRSEKVFLEAMPHFKQFDLEGFNK